ncbi:MAG: U32 family peptidase [Clostridiales bacterium]|nr:U32 family peptidase [Clostridiales bacterium]
METRDMKKPELLAPAGNFEKLRAVLAFGADAAYLSGERFGMRGAAGNFTAGELEAAVEYAHGLGRRIYVTVNTMPHTDEYAALREYAKFLGKIGADAAIVSDLGVLSLFRDAAPELELHISTQASVVSAAACRAWHSLGAKRVVLARELTLEEIREIRENVPDGLELEAFIHGSMCIAYSGRCLLSNYFTGRDANRGGCAQPCRWNYKMISAAVTEEKRGGTEIPIEEHPEGTFVLASRDLCMIEHIPELVGAGLDSLKIEGRVKSAYYGAVTANAYRIALDGYFADPEGYKFDERLLFELESVSHREYSTGFFFRRPGEDANTATADGYIRDRAYIAVTVSYDEDTGRALFRQKNKLTEGEAVEVVSPGSLGKRFIPTDMRNESGDAISSTPHPGMLWSASVPFPLFAGDILRGAGK